MRFSDYAKVNENKNDVYDKDDRSERNIQNCYKAMCIDVIYRAYEDYFEARMKGDENKMKTLEKWVYSGNFGIFCWVDYDPQAVVDSMRRYAGRPKKENSNRVWGLRNNIGGSKAHDMSGIAWDARGVYGKII